MKKRFNIFSVFVVSIILLVTSCIPAGEEKGDFDGSLEILYAGAGITLLLMLLIPPLDPARRSLPPPSQASLPPSQPSPTSATTQSTQTTSTNQSIQSSSESVQAETEIDALLDRLSSTTDTSSQQAQTTTTTVQAVQPTPALSISTSTNSYQPFEHIEIDVPNLDSSSDYWVEIKPTATGGWDNNSIISYPAITTRTNKINANAIPVSVLSNSNSYELRIRQGSDTYSNPVRIQEVLPQIPASQAGRATATLDIVQNLMREASSDNSYLPQMSLSSVYQSSQGLGIDPLALDQLSESILTEITDGAISTITDDRSSLNAMQEIDDLIEECFDDLENSTPIEEGYEYVLSCYAEVSEEVLDDEQLIDEMSELYDENIGIGRASASMLEYIAEQDLADGDLENLLAASLISEAGTQSLEIAEDLPEDFDSDDPEYLAERENEEDTFDDVSEDIEDFQDYVEQDIDYDDFAESFGDSSELDALRNLEGNVIDDIDNFGSDALNINSQQFKNPEFDYERANEWVDLLYSQHPQAHDDVVLTMRDKDGDIIEQAKCSKDPDFYEFFWHIDRDNIEKGTVSLKCSAMRNALANNQFFENVYEPLNKIIFSAIIDSPEFTDAETLLRDELFNYSDNIDYSNYPTKLNKSEVESDDTNTSEKLTCDVSYTQFQSSKADILSCVHSSLVLDTSDCQAGSYIPSERGIDVGGSDVCITYSRDYLKSGQCIEGYEKVFFLEKDRCRWTGLTLDEVVAYTINTTTQEQEVVIR